MTEENSGAQGALENPQEQPTEQPVEPKKDGEGEPPKEGEEPRKKNGYEKLKLRLEKERAEKAELQAKLQEIQTKAPPAKTDAEPKLEDFEDWSDFIKATAKYEASNALKETEKKTREQQLRAEAETKQKTFHEKSREYAKSVPDFGEAIEELDDSGLMTPLVNQAIVESDMGPQLAYYLAQNPEEALKVSKMAYGEMNRYLGKLELKLEAKTPPKTTNAPPPITPARGSASASLNPYERDLTPEEYKAWRAKQKR